MKLSEEINEKFKELRHITHFGDHHHVLEGFWQMLKRDEELFIELMNSNTPTLKNGNAEYGPVLYILNHDVEWEITVGLRLLGMPHSAIETKEWGIWLESLFKGPGVLAADGSLFVESLYAGLDPKWFEALLYYIFFKIDKHGVAKFATKPATLAIPNQDQLTIAIVGDWGTGAYDDSGFESPSVLVGKAIAAQKPDITIHLGDVYYAGRPVEETEKLLKNFPEGKLASFTMNSNHEMYDGANGYFNTALANPIFVKQQGTSYFAILFNEWVIIGVDSAYYDTSSLYMNGALTDANQLKFIKSLNITASQKIIFLSHHVALELDGSAANGELFNQVHAALGRYPDYWYYGHVHNGIVYNNKAITGKYKCPSGQSPQVRCFGHGAIPFGKAIGLIDPKTGKMLPTVDYFAQTPMPNPKELPLIQLRVLNGFAMITLQKGKITEKAFEVSSMETRLAWQNPPAS